MKIASEVLPHAIVHQQHSSGGNGHAHEEDDYEDMMTPTDDEGITSLNHTQKIPISLIKAKDKASVSQLIKGAGAQAFHSSDALPLI